MGGMDLEPLLRWWRAQDAAFDRVEPAWWGAVVSDARFPTVQEANYARVETRQPVGLAEIEAELGPAMSRTAGGRSHVVVFHPDAQTDLISEASTRGERLTWDLVMAASAPPGDEITGVAVHEVVAFDEIAADHRDSLRWFGIEDAAVVDQLETMERTVMIPAGRRWLVVRERGHVVALAGLLILEGVGYLDHVVTLPEGRNRGYASALTARALAIATASGADRTYLLAEPHGAAVRMYDRLGFRPVTQIASWISPSAG